MNVVVDEELCTGCGCCILVCPEEAIDNRPSFVARIDPERCTGCLMCMDNCPTQALSKGYGRTT